MRCADESRTGAIITVIVGTGLAVGAEWAATRIVRRSQRSGDTDVLAADDALRATAVSMTVSIAVLAGVSAITAAVQSVIPQAGPWFVLTIAVTLIGMAVSVAALSTVIRQETWGYRRRHRQAVPAGAA